MLADAAARQEDARRQIEESMNLVLTSRIDCARATELVQRELSMRVKETAHFKKQLEAQLFETDQALQLTGISFTTVRRELEASEIPLRAALDMQLMSKRGRKGRLKEDGQEAGIRELVQKELDDDTEMLKSKYDQLTTKAQALKGMLDALTASREKMHEDQRCKLLAQKIDASCLQVTGLKAIELDRSNPIAGRVLSSRRLPRSARGDSQGSLATSFNDF